MADSKKDPKYMAWLHTLPCAVRVEGEDSGCFGPITAHHAGTRGLRQKCPDREAIPLCFGHHQEGPKAIHRIGKRFWNTHGLDKEVLIAELNRVYEMTGGAHA